MIHSVDYVLSDFPESLLGKREHASLAIEDLHGGVLIDNLILLRFMTIEAIAKVLKDRYNKIFVWLEKDSTPDEFKEIAARYRVAFHKETPQIMIVYIPVGIELDDANLQVDIPNYVFKYVFIADCNLRIIRNNLDMSVLSSRLADFRPLLVLRRLILDCKYSGSTDIAFSSFFADKKPVHKIQYRIKREVEDSTFKLERSLIQRVVQSAVSKLSSASAADLDSRQGVTTDIANLFGDGSTDLRLTGMQVEAGLFVNISVQTTDTTTMTLDELGFPKKDVFTIRDLAKRRTGLTLVTGEMRSGKNTTIFAMLNEIVNDPIRIMEYSNPVENRMPFPQVNYKGDIELLKALLRLAKKQDIDIAVLNEIPNADVAFAVRDLVNSAIGVITTTHVDRVWHAPNKLNEFFGSDYKSIISQLNAIVNHKMFRRWSCPKMIPHKFVQDGTEFAARCWKFGVRQYFTPAYPELVRYGLQPLAEILIMNDELKTKMLNFSEMWEAERLIHDKFEREQNTIEYKLASYINAGICSLDEMRRIY